jgi:hypothetical protein
MTVLDKAVAMLQAADPHDLHTMSPAERKRLADLFWQWWFEAEPVQKRQRQPTVGVLASLRDGERSP